MITAIFNSDSAMANAYGLWQWDYGQVLRIQGLHLPSMVEIHFSLQETGGTSVNRVGVTKDGVTDVIIPDSMLENDGADRTYDMFAFIYLTDATSGQTEYKIKLQVKSRPKPEVPGGGENPNIFHEAVQAVQKSADKAAESEKQAEGWTHGREDLPERAQDNAKYYAGQAAADAKKTGTDRKEVERLVESVSGIDEQVIKVENLTKQAQTSATNAALSEQAAKTAETNAQNAQAGAEIAEGNAELAEQGAKASKQAVEKAKQLVTQMGQEVLDNKNHVDQTAQAFTLTAQQAVADVNNAGQTQTERVEGAGNDAVESVKTAQTAATKAVETAKTEAVEAVQTEGTTQTGNVTAEGTKQVQAVQQAAQEIVADREQIAQNKADVTALKEDLGEASNKLRSYNLLNADKCESGYIAYNTGNVFSHKTYYHSDYIPITEGKTYSLTDSIKIQHFAFYDSEKAFYSSLGENNLLAYSGGSKNGFNYFVAPVTGYARFTLNNETSVSTAMVIENEPDSITVNKYVPYYYSVEAVSESVEAVSESLGILNLAYKNLKKIYRNYSFSSDGGLINKDGSDIYEVELTGGASYFFNDLNGARNNTWFYDADENALTQYTSLGYYNSVITISDNATICRFVYANSPIILTVEDYATYKNGFTTKLPSTVDLSSALPSALQSALPSALPPALQFDFIEYLNMINPDTVTVGKYVYKNGVLLDNSGYDTTDYIPISEGQTYYLFNRLSSSSPRTLCYYDINKNSLADYFMDSSSGTSSYIIPCVQDARYVRITLTSGKANQYMLTMESEPTQFKKFGKYQIRKEALGDTTKPIELNVAYSHCGGNALKDSVDSLSSGTTLELSEFPKNLKKGLSMTFYANFETFTSVTVGKGYGSYRGDWFEIDSTNIVWKHYESEESTRETKAHGFTISGFLMVALNVDEDSICHVTLSTLSDTATFTFNWVYEQNGLPFVFGGQDMTNVELGAVANDIDCPVWLFGDSYFGVGSNRIIGQLKNLGYADYCLIDGLAGQGSSGAYSDLEKLMALGGVPKMLIWCLGMNDNVSSYQTNLAKLKGLSEKYGFELILQKVPVVPARIEQNTGVNVIVAESGLRYIDAYKAVGADDTGTWYTDYLSSDKVHPSVNGAKAIATRMLIDAPEIMQYGYRQGSVGGGISGDK